MVAGGVDAESPKGTEAIKLPPHQWRSRSKYRRRAGPGVGYVSIASVPFGLALGARQIAALYTRRMQIDLSFRDRKPHRYDEAFEDSLTRKDKRIEVLL